MEGLILIIILGIIVIFLFHNQKTINSLSPNQNATKSIPNAISSSKKKRKVDTKKAEILIFNQLKGDLDNLKEFTPDLIYTVGIQKLAALCLIANYIENNNEWGTASTSRIINSLVKKLEGIYKTGDYDGGSGFLLKDEYLNYKKLYQKGGKQMIIDSLVNSNPNLDENSIEDLKGVFNLQISGATDIRKILRKYR